MEGELSPHAEHPNLHLPIHSLRIALRTQAYVPCKQWVIGSLRGIFP